MLHPRTSSHPSGPTTWCSNIKQRLTRIESRKCLYGRTPLTSHVVDCQHMHTARKQRCIPCRSHGRAGRRTGTKGGGREDKRSGGERRRENRRVEGRKTWSLDRVGSSSSLHTAPQDRRPSTAAAHAFTRAKPLSRAFHDDEGTPHFPYGIHQLATRSSIRPSALSLERNSDRSQWVRSEQASRTAGEQPATQPQALE